MKEINDNTSGNILDQALQQLSKGESLGNVVDSLTDTEDQKIELTAVLEIAQLLNSIPKAAAPTPTKQYRYAQKVGVFQKILQLFSNNKVSVFAATFAFLIIGGFSLVKAADNSLPGDRLYGLKLIGEEAQLNLTFNQDKIASIHLALAEKRLDEAKRVIEINDPAQEAVAIAALTNQTEKTFNAVSQIATTKAVSQNDSRLLDNLVAINKEQKSVLESASKDANTKESAQVALSATKETDKSLAKIIAAVNEQALLDLPNKISVTGTVTSYSKNNLIIEKNTFVVNNDTEIVSATGELMVDKFDTITGKITVIGTKDNNSNLIAKKIVLIDGSTSLASDKVPDKGQVKGVITTTKSDTKPTTTTPTATTPPVTSDEDNSSPQKPSQTQAGFIIEPSNQQYIP